MKKCFEEHNSYDFFWICSSCKRGYATTRLPTGAICSICGNDHFCKAVARLLMKKNSIWKPSTWFTHRCGFDIKKWLEAVPSDLAKLEKGEKT
jgi:hypothetical protein